MADTELNIRQEFEKREHEMLSEYASFSDKSKGREREESQCDIRTVYQRDRDRIIHCKAFRRLKDKTQVFLTPEGDHYRTRLTHTLEVSQIARSISKALFLNEDLTEAIALGHDLGHTPYGHAGERALRKACNGGFYHNEQSIRVVKYLEKHGKGLNLSYEVLDGILNHRSRCTPSTLEGKVVQLADKIAYINHDIDDAARAGIIKESEIPDNITRVIGNTLSERLNSLIHEAIRHSQNTNNVSLSEDYLKLLLELRGWMFEHVYTNPAAKGEEGKAEMMIIRLFEYYKEHMNELPEEYLEVRDARGESDETAICDYIAGMTDRYCEATFIELMVPKRWKG